MLKGVNYTVGRIERKADEEGECLEEMLRRMVAGKEPIKATANLQYHDRKDGVLPEHDIRSDRFNFAMMAADKMHATTYAQRMSTDGFMFNQETGKWETKPTETTEQ